MHRRLYKAGKYSLVIASLLIQTGLISVASAQVSSPSGELRKTESSDIWPHTMTGNHFNEFWNYQFYLNDDLRVHIIFSVNNFGTFKSPVTGVRVTVFGLGPETYNLNREYNLDWLALDKEAYTFRPREDRELFFTGKLPESHRVRIYTTKDNITYDIDLRLSSIQQGRKWGDGLFRIGREEIGMITQIPYAEVRGHVEVDGNRKNVHGTAYMDQTWQNQMTTRLLHSGYRFVYHGSPDNWDISYFLLPSDRGNRNVIGYRLQNNDGNVKKTGITRISELTPGRAFGRSLAQMLSVQLDDGRKFQLSRSSDHESFSILSELSWIPRRAARAYLGGEVFDFRGQAYFREEGSPPKTGEYNFFVID